MWNTPILQSIELLAQFNGRQQHVAGIQLSGINISHATIFSLTYQN